MLRIAYLAALAGLQVMLAWQLVPIIAAALQRHIPLGALPDGWASIAQVATAAVCVVGAGLALGYPCVALMRHVQRGVQRFAGLPRWTVGLTLVGTAVLFIGGTLHALAARGVELPGLRLLADALPLVPTGIALMSAGVLLGEILRRNRPLRTRSIAVVPPLPSDAAAWRRAA